MPVTVRLIASFPPTRAETPIRMERNMSQFKARMIQPIGFPMEKDISSDPRAKEHSGDGRFSFQMKKASLSQDKQHGVMFKIDGNMPSGTQCGCHITVFQGWDIVTLDHLIH
jgi:hypothetical protein